MPTITLTDPTAHTLADAGVIATNNGNLRTLLNSGLDAVNLKGNPSLAAGEVPVWNGTQFDRSTVTKIGNTSLNFTGTPTGSKFLRDDFSWQTVASGPTYQTTLPGSPTDGQQTILVDSTTAPTWAWFLRFNSTSAKWDFIGGSSIFAEVTTAEGTASTTYVALATAGPSITVPVAGDYFVEIGSKHSYSANSTSNFHSYDIGGTGAVDADAINTVTGSGAGTNVVSIASKARKKTALAASTALVSKYKAATGTATFADRWMRVTPIRVG